MDVAVNKLASQHARCFLSVLEAYDADTDTDTTIAREVIVPTLASRKRRLETMYSRPTLPDGRVYRDEDLVHTRLAQRYPTRANSTAPRDKTTPPMNGEPKFDGSLSVETTPPALSPGLDRRHVVFPDPVAFRCVSIWGLLLAVFHTSRH